jgi:hypothetical protein
MFKLANNGYSMTFKNGYTVSVRWHECVNYVSKRNLTSPVQFKDMAADSGDAEVAVMDKSETFIQTPFSNGDVVIGWQSPDQVLKIMNWAASLSGA